MYLRAVHAEHHIPTLREFIRENPLGIFTTAIDSDTHPFLQSSHIPFILDVNDDESDTELGVLRGHMARANPQTKALVEHLSRTPGSGPKTLERDVLILFNNPQHHYITPKFYRETKPTTGKVVPTWDYAAVQVYGRVTVYFDAADPSTDTFLSSAISVLSRYSETRIMGYEKPWEVQDAPASYVGLLKKAIIGIEVKITDMGGKWKMSQELSQGDRDGVIEGLRALGTADASEVAGMVEDRCKLADDIKAKTS